MGPTLKPSDVASPCIDVCTLDPATQVCLGCYRTIEEIAAWGAASNAERAAIVVELARRRELFARSDNQSAMPPEWRPEKCARCGAQFACGAGDPSTSCWCASYPALVPEAGAASCICPACMALAARSQGA